MKVTLKIFIKITIDKQNAVTACTSENCRLKGLRLLLLEGHQSYWGAWPEFSSGFIFIRICNDRIFFKLGRTSTIFPSVSTTSIQVSLLFLRHKVFHQFKLSRTDCVVSRQYKPKQNKQESFLVLNCSSQRSSKNQEKTWTKLTLFILDSSISPKLFCWNWSSVTTGGNVSWFRICTLL